MSESRELTIDDVARQTPPSMNSYGQPMRPLDDDWWDEYFSWGYDDGRVDEHGQLLTRPQTRTYRIMGVDGKPTGKITQCRSYVQASAIRRELRTNSDKVYIPKAILLDIVFDD